MKRLGVLGASGHGKIVAEAAILSGWNDVFFYDDRYPKLKNNSHWSVVGDMSSLISDLPHLDGIIVAIGDNSTRFKKSEEIKKAGANMVTVVHPTATISRFSSVGEGCFVAAGAVVHVDSCLDDYVIVNTAAVIEHDCNIGKSAHISSGATLAGNVTVGSSSWVGLNACVRQLIQVGDDVVIGAGSVVVKDIESGRCVVGNPARAINR